MPRFQVTGTARDTGRKRKRTYAAANEAAARSKAHADGIDVAEVSELFDPPTENQLSYAQSLGIAIPAGVTREELSDLISQRTDDDKPASADLLALATSYGAKVTNYTGKKLAFHRIFDHLTTTPDRQQDLAAWFAYRVYRELVHGAAGTAITSPNDPSIQAVAQQLAAQPDVMQSIRRYEGHRLIWFGQWTSPSGSVHEGGSNRTIAYRRAAELLRPTVAREKAQGEALVRERHYDRSESPPIRRSEPAAKGCLSVMVLVAVFTTAAAAILAR